MSKDHAIMLLDVAVKTMESWAQYAHSLAHVLNLLREAKGNLEAAPTQVATDEQTIVGLMGDRGIRGLATNNIGREDAEAVLRDIRAGRVPGVCVAAPAQVTDAAIDRACAMWDEFRDMHTERCKESGFNRCAMRAAILAALGEK